MDAFSGATVRAELQTTHVSTEVTGDYAISRHAQGLVWKMYPESTSLRIFISRWEHRIPVKLFRSAFNNSKKDTSRDSTVCRILTILQEVPSRRIQRADGKPGPAGNPRAQRHTNSPTGRTERSRTAERIQRLSTRRPTVVITQALPGHASRRQLQSTHGSSFTRT